MSRTMTVPERDASGGIDYRRTTIFLMPAVDKALVVTCCLDDGTPLSGNQPSSFTWPLTPGSPVTAEDFDHYTLIPDWQPSTAYSVGDRVRHGYTNGDGMYTYRCTQAGVSGSSGPHPGGAYPAGRGVKIDGTCTWIAEDDREAGLLGLPWGIGRNFPLRWWQTISVESSYSTWQPSTAYGTGNRVVGEFDRRYVCVQAGVSASSGPGPTGTDQGIVDGTVRWDFTESGPSSGGAVAYTVREDLLWIVFETDPYPELIVNPSPEYYVLAESGIVRAVGTAIEAKNYLLANDAPPTNNWWHHVYDPPFGNPPPDRYLDWMNHM
jgi:hypothetical protein